MGKYEFKVVFQGSSPIVEYVTAWTIATACILAQAERIKKDMNYEIAMIYVLDGGNKWLLEKVFNV